MSQSPAPSSSPPPSTSASSSTGAAELPDSLYDYVSPTSLFKQPCFREAALWGIGSGTVVALFQWAKLTKQPTIGGGNVTRTMLNWGYLAGAVAMTGSWVTCRQRSAAQRETMRFYMNNQDKLREYVQSERGLDDPQHQTQVLDPNAMFNQQDNQKNSSNSPIR